MRSRVRRKCYYDARVNDIDLRDITSSENNANILRALRDEQPDNYRDKIGLFDGEIHEDEEDDDDCFGIREEDDLGWVGYFVGRSKYLEGFYIMGLPEESERIEALIEGVTRNQSINTLSILSDDVGDVELAKLAGFRNLSTLNLSNCIIDSERAHVIASSLSQMRPYSMERFVFCDNIIDDEMVLAKICGALRSHSQLEHLSLKGNDIGRNECVTLGNMLSSWHAPKLKYLFLDNNSIDDDGLQALVGGMTNCSSLLGLSLSGNRSITAAGLRSLSTYFQSGSCSLQYLKVEDNSIDDGGLHALVEGLMNCCNLEILSLSGNRSITAAGLRSLSTLFQSRSCALEELVFYRMNIGNDGATALADGLVGNKSLKHLIFDVDSSGITEIGWSAFSKLLCDTSSINNTYLSNHTLELIIGAGNNISDIPGGVLQHLSRNIAPINKHYVATWKILRHFDDYDDLDIESLFQWKLKFLPLVVTWFERARSSIAPLVSISNFLEELETRKLSAVHKFVRGMPMLIIDGYNSRRTSTRLARKRRLNGEAKN